jgi:hypothetical protein
MTEHTAARRQRALFNVAIEAALQSPMEATAARRQRALFILADRRRERTSDGMTDSDLVTEIITDLLSLTDVTPLGINFDACLSRARATHKQESEK